MGGVLFIVASVAGFYVLRYFLQGSGIVYSRREPFALGYPRASGQVDPIIITPVEEVEPIPERLPQVALDFVPTIAATPTVARSSEVSPNFSTTPAKIEESLLFRSLTLALFAVSVISVDVAAGTQFSWVGIPFVTVGAAWSWYRRYHAKHWLNTVVSVASIAIIFGVFVPTLFRQIPSALEPIAPASKMSATIELTLATIAILLQMGLSFHLYSRRVLGYCILISGILIGVAAGLSQSIGFLILLSGFMAIAMPTLMLDYRSRLALKPLTITPIPAKGQLSYQHLPWKYLTQIAGIAIGLGLILAVFLPNFQIPNLSFPRAGINPFQTLAQTYRQPNSNPQSPPNPGINSPPQLNPQELAAKVLRQPTNNNYPDTIKSENLQLPPELAKNILATSPQPLNSDFDRATYLAEYLKQHHQDAPPSPNPPPLDQKLIKALISKCAGQIQTCKLVGDQQDLSVVYTSMLRAISIPARLKTGDQPAQIDPQTGLYQRPAKQSQSQTEVYFPNWGWFGLNSIPNQPIVNPTTGQLNQLQAQAQLSLTPSHQSSPNNSTPQPNSPQSLDNSSAKTPAVPSVETVKPLDPNIFKAIALQAGYANVIILVIIGGIAWYYLYHRQQQQQLASLPPIEQIYRSMIVSLYKTGNAKTPAQTQLEYAHSIKNTEHPQIAKVVWEISQLYTAWRYGKERIDVRQLTKKLQTLQYLQQLADKRKRQQKIATQT
jgi:TgpA N-terminal domain/Transglutaminase-like superfamily